MCMLSRSVVSLCGSLDCHCQAPLSMGFSSKNIGVGCHFLLQGIVPTQGSKLCLLCLLHWQMDSLPTEPSGTTGRILTNQDPMAGINFLSCLPKKAKSLSRVRLFATPWTVAHQSPPSMEFPRQEYCSGLPFLLQGIFLTQQLNLRS